MNNSDGAIFEKIKTFFGGRYVRLTVITLFGALLIYLVALILFSVLGIADKMPNQMVIFLALCTSGWLVYKYLSERIAG
ncbi:MAG: hypothetical protein WBB39_02955 [Candidatus Saccharimonadales bacterium]